MPFKFGVIAQLGERYNGIVEVGGSIPPGSTKFMNEIRLILAYSFSVLLIPVGIFGIFNSSFFQFESKALSFYLRLSSVFITLILIFLSWYYSNIFIRKKVLDKLSDFGKEIVNSDFSKISKEEIPDMTKETISNLRHYEDYRFEFFGFSIPFFIVFLTTGAIDLYQNPASIFPHIIGCFILTMIIKFANIMVSICDISSQANSFISTITNIAYASKGVQLYNSFKFIESRLQKDERANLKQTEKDIKKAIWKSFLYVAILFVFILAIYIVKKEYVCSNLFNVDGIEHIYLTSMFVYLLFLVSFFRYLKINKISFMNISKHQLEDDRTVSDKKTDENNLFITMHGVYFQDPTKLSEFPVLDNLSLSVLPGELIAITGENLDGRSYLFDLLLGYYRVQSGKIYIAGTRIDNISKQKIRSLIGLFDEGLGLIRGTVYDNLEMVTDNKKKILAISEKVGLQDCLEENIFNEGGELILSQEILFRIQIGRIAIQKPKILLIKSPESFESEATEKMFYDFVEFSSERKTLLISTDNPRIMIYSNKILYIRKGESLFGTHAELSKNENYQRYIKNI